MRILVTGGAGYVGSAAARLLVESGHTVVALDNLSEGHRSAAPPGTLVEGDLADRALVARLLRERDIEAVMHFAGSTYVGVSMSEPDGYWRNNVAHTLGLLEAMHEAGVPRIVFSSTCAVFGETAEMPLSEDAPIRPESTYAFTKYAIERMIADFARAYALRYVVLRYFNASGASADGAHGEDHRPETHLIPLVIQTVLGQRKSLQVFGSDYPTPDGTCIRDYVHVDDLATAHQSALLRLADPEGPAGRAYNLGTGTGSSVLEVIQAVERVTGKPVPREVSGRRAGDTPRLVAGAGRARSELDWSPQYAELDAVVASAWAWHRAHPDGYRD